MGEIKNLTLAFSCSEKIDSKLHCTKCAHTLVDFTQKTDAELSHEIAQSASTVCGVFKQSQLSDQFLRYAAATIIATSAALPVRGQGQGDNTPLPDKVFSISQADGKVKHALLGFVITDQAEPVGGYDRYYGELYKSILIPPDQIKPGEAYMELSVDEDGQITDYRIVKGISEGVDKEVLRAAKSLNFPFTPARQGNRRVPVKLIVQVNVEASTKRN